MDIGSLFEHLDEDYKDVLLAAAVGFPITYLDCWRLHPRFRDYEIFQQIMLTLGVDFIFIGIGVLYCIFMWKAMKHHQERPPYPEFNIFGLLVTFTITSSMVLVDVIKTPIKFEAYYLGYSFIFILFQFIRDKVSYRRKVKESKNSEERD